LYPYNDYTTEWVVERAGPSASSYIPSTGLLTLRTRLVRDTLNGTPAAHGALDIGLVETEDGTYQGVYDGGDIASGFPEVVAGETTEAWELLYSANDLRVLRKVKIKPLRVVRA
jgi:hypothetical protein